MRKKLITLLLAIGCAFGVGGLVACDSNGCGSDEVVAAGKHEVVYVLQKSMTSENYQVMASCKACKFGQTLKEVARTECDISRQEATCTQVGMDTISYTYKGVELSFEDEYAPMTGHDFSEEYSATYDSGKYFLERSCIVCDYAGKIEVDPDNRVIPSTCTEGGYTQKVYTDNGREFKWEKEAVERPLEHNIVSEFLSSEGNFCEKGGVYITHCSREGCGHWVSSVDVVAPEHHSTSWQVTKEPTLHEEGTLQGVCSGCEILVKGKYVDYAGCGEQVQKVLPVVNTKNYTSSGRTNVNEDEWVDFRITIDEQEFTFSLFLTACVHRIERSDGTFEEMPPDTKIYADDERYVGSWNLFAGQKVSCSNTEGALAMYNCVDCGGFLSIYILARHTRPNGSTSGGYNCTVCEQYVYD